MRAGDAHAESTLEFGRMLSWFEATAIGTTRCGRSVLLLDVKPCKREFGTEVRPPALATELMAAHRGRR
jgi:hypothetical protein